MEQPVASTFFTSQLVVELLEFFFFCPVLSWVDRSKECHMRCLPFLISLVGFFSLVFRIQEDGSAEKKALEGSKVAVARHAEGEFTLTREDVEMIVESLGIGCSGGGDEQFDEVAGVDDLNCLFEEEPSLEEVKEAFSVFDRNGDGYIDAEELQRVLLILGFKESAAGDCRRMIAAHDENCDGRIDFHEFVKLMECSFS